MTEVCAGNLTYAFEEIEKVFASLFSDLFGIKPHMRSHYELFMGVMLLGEGDGRNVPRMRSWSFNSGGTYS